MNREEIRKAIAMLNKGLKGEMTNYLAYCPICLGLVSIKEESEEYAIVECSNTKCPLISYTINLERLKTYEEII